MNYKDFWINIMSDGSVFARSHEGEQSEKLVIDEVTMPLIAQVVNLGQTNIDFLKKFGTLLFSSVFTGKIDGLFRASLTSARVENSGLRIRIIIENEEYANLPWEYLYDTNNQSFLCISSENVVSRYINVQRPILPLKVTIPIKVLVVISGPSDLPLLDVAKEVSLLRESVKDISDLVNLSILSNPTLANLRQEMRTGNYQVLHFIGHGMYVPDERKGYLFLVDETGLSKPLDEEVVGSIFVGDRNLRLIFLNACESAKSDDLKAFVGIAPKLISQGALAVIAMQHKITDQASLIFAHDFYASLATGLPVDSSVQEGRKALLVELGPDRREFGTPVLYMRAPNGHLFDVMGKRVDIPSAPLPTVEEDAAIKLPFYCSELVKGNHRDRERSLLLYDFGYIFIRLDQISATGAWGRSLLGCMRKVATIPLGWDLMRTEGGIITTATCIKGLASQFGNKELFAYQQFVRDVVDYFTIRQDEIGGIGNLGSTLTKMGKLEILKTQPRHTALGIMALLAIEEGHQEIYRGLRYLLKATAADYDKDFSSAMAMAFTVSAFQACKRSEWFYDNLTSAKRDEIFSEWKNMQVDLIQKLAHLDSSYRPFWKPYSDFPLFSYESFLLICDVFVEDIPDLLRHRIQDGLLSLLERVRKFGGLPFHREATVPDVGLTGFLLSCLSRGAQREQFTYPELQERITELCPSMYSFLVNSFDTFDPKASVTTRMSWTYSATMAELITLPKCVETRENVIRMSKLDQIVNDVSIDDKEKKIKFGSRFTAWFEPHCDVQALKHFLEAKLIKEQ